MSMVRVFQVVVGVSVGLACTAAWSKDVPAKPKTEEVQAGELKLESVTGAGTVTFTGAAATPVAGTVGMTADSNGAMEVVSEKYGRKFRITQDPQNGIKIVQITKKGGTDVTEKYEAKDLRELEKKFPAGFELYQEHVGNKGLGGAAGMGMIQVGPIQGPILLPGNPAVPPGGFAPPPGGMQVVPGAGTIVVTATAVMAPDQLDGVSAMMQGLSESLKEFTKAAKLKDAKQSAKDAAKKQIGELKKQLFDLEKQLEAK